MRSTKRITATAEGHGYVHDNENCAHDNTLYAAAQNGVRNDGECLVDNHVREEQRHQQQVAVLADWLYLVRVHLLVTDQAFSVGPVAVQEEVGPETRTHGVPLMLKTFSCVSSRLM